jgi:hypothetical protein
MTFVLTQPQAMMTAATDVAEIGSALSQAHAAAAGSITDVAAAAADEVSEATATLFSGYARAYQAISAQAEAFHDEFTQALGAAADSYLNAEAAASRELGALATPAQALLAPVPVTAALIMSGSGVPTPSPFEINAFYTHYIQPNFPSATPPRGLSIPNGLYPFTGGKDLTLDVSVARGVTVLHDAILQQLAALPPGSSIAVSGFSQGAVVASMAMPTLLAHGVTSSQVSFVLVGDPMNPNGGLLARFPGLILPSVGMTFYGATPTDAFPTVIYTLEYDGFADFPQYPINLLADLNAVMGIFLVHSSANYTAAQLATAVQLPTAGPTQTTYYMIPTENLPLLAPLRYIPYIGNPLADLLQPDVRALVNWGYGDPAHGYSTGPADVATPFGFLPPHSATAALGPALVDGFHQGISDATNTLAAQGPPHLPSPSALSQGLTSLFSGSSTPPAGPPTITDILTGLQTTNTRIANTVTTATSAGSWALLATADRAAAVWLTLPSYGVNIFLDGILQALDGQPLEGLINAIGRPIAANLGLVTVLGGMELIVVGYTLSTVFTGDPHPGP